MKQSIDVMSQEARRLANARLLNAEEAEAIAMFISDMRAELKRLESAEAGAVDVASNVTVAYYELEGMVKLLKSDLNFAQSRTTI